MATEWIQVLKELGPGVPRALSLLGHAVLGANAAVRGGQHPLAGIPAALTLEGLSHSDFGNSLAGSGALVAGYVPLALTSMDLRPLIDWIKKFLEVPEPEPRPTFPDIEGRRRAVPAPEPPGLARVEPGAPAVTRGYSQDLLRLLGR